MEGEHPKILSLELKLDFILDPIKSLFAGKIESKGTPQVLENISLVNHFSILAWRIKRVVFQ